jgi:hypothetical protein
MFGCLRSLGCLVLLGVAAVAAWLYRDRWMPLLHRGPTPSTAEAPASAGTAGGWQPVSSTGASRAREAIGRLGSRSGPVFVTLSASDVAAYIYDELKKQLPASAESVQTSAAGDQLFVRASVRPSDFGDIGMLGPLASMLRDREPVEFGGTLDVVQPGLGEYHVKSLRIRELSVPQAMIPRIIQNASRGSRPPRIAADALPLQIPPYIADVRVKNGKVTLYKAVK